MSSVLGFDYANILIVDGDTLHTTASKGIPLTILAIPLTAKSIVARTARTGKTQLVPDTHLDPDFLRGTQDSRSELDVPIRLDGKTVAVLNAESLKPAAFTEEDAAAAELLATHAASAYQRLKNIQQLRNAEELHRTILETSPNPISITQEGEIVYANKRRLELTGATTLEQLIGQNGISFVHPDDMERVQTRIRDFTSGKLPPTRYEYRCQKPDGTYINIEANSAPINYRGHPALLHVLTDVTQRQRYQDQLTNLQGYARDLATTETLYQASKIIGRAVQEMIESSFGSIGFIEGKALRFIYVYGVDWIEGGEMPIDGPGITTRAVRTGQTQLIQDVTQDPDYHLTYSDTTTSKSEAVIPIRVNEQIVGVINVESTRTNAYTQNDVQILEMLANHFSSTIQRIRAAEAVKISETRYRNLFEGVNDAILITTPDGRIQEANEVTAQLLGYPREELLGMNITQITTPTGLAKLPERLEKLNKEGHLIFESEYMTKNRLISEAEINARVIELGGEKALFSTWRDISQRKKTERGLIALNRCAVDLATADTIDSIWDSAINALKNGFDYKWAGIAVADGDHIHYARFIGAPPPEGFTLPIDGPGITTRAIKTGETQHVKDTKTDEDYTTFPTPEGENTMQSELVVPVKFNGKTIAAINIESPKANTFTENDQLLLEILTAHISSALTRIDLIKKQQNALKTALRQEAAAERARELATIKTRFLSSATHEIRTPLTSITGYTELIQNALNTGDHTQLPPYFEAVKRNAERLTRLTDDLLDSQRIEEGRLKIQKTRIKTGTLLHDLVQEATPELTRRGQTLTLSDDLDAEINVDRDRMIQVLANLVSNASTFSQPNTTIHLTIKKRNNETLFTVHDEGIGLTPEDMTKLFKPFPGIRVEGNKAGSGLGLSICIGIIELHGGHIWAESKGPGKGSTFSFTIPNIRT